MNLLNSQIERSLKRQKFWEAREFFLTVPGAIHMNYRERASFLNCQWNRRLNSPYKKKILLESNGNAYYLDDQGRKVMAHPKFDRPRGWWPKKIL